MTVDGHDNLVVMRRRARETWDTCVQLATQHLAAAEREGSPDKEFDQQNFDNQVRVAEVYARLALACQKVPGSQF